MMMMIMIVVVVVVVVIVAVRNIWDIIWDVVVSTYSSVHTFWPCLAFEASTGPVVTSTHAALAYHPTM
jgi:dolichyl-phosphate-mannose--protein O-mannosyl transferase